MGASCCDRKNLPEENYEDLKQTKPKIETLKEEKNDNKPDDNSDDESLDKDNFIFFAIKVS